MLIRLIKSYSYLYGSNADKNIPTMIQDMSFRARLARPCSYLCDQIAPVPVVHKRQLSTRLPQPIYPLPLPINPAPEPPATCPPTVVPINIGEYPTSRVVKPGEILATMVEDLPRGYLWCDGRLVSRSTYALLFSIIGTYYGEGDGVYTFYLPNLSNDANPNVKYIIKYNTYVEPYCSGGGGGGAGSIDNPVMINSALGDIQILSYPIAYSPPPGTILYNTVNYVPTGYLACDGSEVSRSEYAFLFNMIGTIYGAGNGDSTFNLPNLTLQLPPYRYIIRYDVPDNITFEINKNLRLTDVALSGLANITLI